MVRNIVTPAKRNNHVIGSNHPPLGKLVTDLWKLIEKKTPHKNKDIDPMKTILLRVLLLNLEL